MTTVLLIRHGRTTANSAGVLAGWTPNVHLDEKGELQAAALGERLASVGLDRIVASPLERCQETAALINRPRGKFPLSIELDERIGECHYGDWTGRTLKDLAKEPMWKVVQQHPAAAVFPGSEGESLAQMSSRAVAAVRDWNAQLGSDATYAIVSHGDVIKAILADAMGLHLDSFQRIGIDPASLSVVRYTPYRPMIERVNDTGGAIDSLLVKARRRRSGNAALGGGAGH